MRGSISESFLRKFGQLLARLIYRVEVDGRENIPAEGVLLIPNHVTWIDAVILQLACPRPIRFVVYEPIYRQPLLKPIFKAVQAIPIAPEKPRAALGEAAQRLKEGEIVCVFPEGELTRSGSLLRLKKGFELLARMADVGVLPVWLDELWGSVFSYSGGRYFTKLPIRLPYHVRVAFGRPLTAEEADIATVREELLILGEQCYQRRETLTRHLAEACLRGLRRRQFRTAVVDGMDDSRLSRGTLLAAAAALSRDLKQRCHGRRVAVVLPPTKGAVVANLAVLLAGKVPVNLNFTAGRAALESAIQRGDLTHALTARQVERKLKDLAWPKEKLYLEDLMPPLKTRILMWRALVFLIPSPLLVKLLGTPKRGDGEEAVLLFTSGSSGEPKGVVLSHRNILGNVTQFGLMLSLGKDDAILASLPFYHSFGCTVTLWYPLIEGVPIVSYPSPLDTVKNLELRVTLLLATPTFMRGYLKRAKPEQLASLKLIITGAEKLPDSLLEAFEERFHIRIMQGYGLTETSPVVSTNLPEPPLKPGYSFQPSQRVGSVGKLAPGIAARIKSPETGEPLSLHDTGMLWLKGPNIFEGYLNDPERTAEMLEHGWLETGDLGRFDEDGFLFIEGRLSRFSKIGGEMVPHETVESKVSEVLDLPTDGDRVIAVVGLPDEAKGEALVALSTREIEAAELRSKLLEAGIPSLWVPKTIRKVDAIPILGSGKLDLKACRELAENR